MKIGAITIGQAPRVDVTCDIMDILGDVELLQGGGLDGLTHEQIATYAPDKDDYVLVSRLNDGTSVTFAEKHILPNLQKRIDELEAAGCKFIMMFCTGVFPDSITSHVPLIYPRKILDRVVPLLTKNSSIITVTPSPLQIEQSENKWKEYVSHVQTIAASPYGSWEDLVAGAKKCKDLEGDLIILDCIGFTQKMKEMFYKESGKTVILPRTMLARVVSELTDVR